MEEKLESGYQLYIAKDIDSEKITGLYIRQRNGATTKMQTKEHELDFMRILPTIEEQLNEGYRLVLGKIENKFYSYITDDKQEERIYETYNSFLLNTLVDIEEKTQGIHNTSKNLGGK